jgi:coenzyme F420-0:L-glutamate ligase / coenzyme F420-1:gamma-L-glutamate ligase
MKRLTVIGIGGLDEVKAGDSIGWLVWQACSRTGESLDASDIFVVAHKIVSKAEGRVVRLADVEPSARARELARDLDKDPAVVEVVLSESRRIIRTGGKTLIVETRHGFICANAGVDLSNVGLGYVALLPEEPDRSARAIREEIRRLGGIAPGVIISDSFGRPWRLGTVDVAIGVAGLKPLKDERGRRDRHGYELRASVSAIADELAGAAELVMGKTGEVPVVLIRGFEIEAGDGSSRDLLRPETDDLFRNF